LIDGVISSGGAWKLDAQLQEGGTLAGRLAGRKRWRQMKIAA